jgi:GNAT superfamily N-acetyltransferase
MGRAFVDDAGRPEAFLINVGPFYYAAGEAAGQGAEELLRAMPAWSLLMPSGPGWFERARVIHAERLFEMPRYSYSPDNVTAERLEPIVASSEYRDSIVAMDVDRVSNIAAVPDHFVDLSDFESPEDFVERGFGYCLIDGDEMVAAGFTSIVCSWGVELSLFVMPEYRCKGLGAALSCRLVERCLELGLKPNWDAANPESCRLAEKLGYVPAGDYHALVVRG